MNKDPIKRVRYFDGEELNRSDFTTDQTYQLEKLRYHAAGLHAWGIASGLDLSVGIDRRSLVISPGMAVDEEGREILLADERVLSLEATNQTIYVVIAYHEELCDFTQETFVQGFKFVCERPRISMYDQPPACPSQELALGLARLDVNGYVTGVEKSDRRYAGIDVGRITFVLNGRRSPLWPWIEGWKNGARTGLRFADDAGQALSPKFQTRFSSDVSFSGNLGVQTNTPCATLDVVRSGDGELAAFAGGASGEIVTATITGGEGRLGVGASTPAARLDIVGGDLHIQSGRRIFFDGDGQILGALADRQRYISLAASRRTMEFSESGEIQITGGYSAAASIPTPPTMVMTADSRVGIGTDQPADQLSVQGIVHTTRGGLMFPDGSIQTTAAITTSVPVGTVLEWWRPSLSIPVPDGFIIVSDGAAGNAYPDLNNKYIRGTGEPGDVGQSGGSASHVHTVNIPEHTHGISHAHPDVSGWSEQSNNKSKAKWDEDPKTQFYVSYYSHEQWARAPVTGLSTSDSGIASTDPLPVLNLQSHDNNPTAVGLLLIYRYA